MWRKGYKLIDEDRVYFDELHICDLSKKGLFYSICSSKPMY